MTHHVLELRVPNRTFRATGVDRPAVASATHHTDGARHAGSHSCIVRTSWRRILAMTAAMLLVFAVLAACDDMDNGTDATDDAQVVETPTEAVETPTPHAEATEEDVAAEAESEPAETPKAEPTPTPEPEEPTPTPEPEPVEPLRYSGSGDDVIQIEKPGGPGTPAIIYARGNEESRHFGVTAYDEFGEYVDLLVNTTDFFEGTMPLDFLENDETVTLEISASGPWEIEIRPIQSARMVAIPGEVSGSGHEVFLIEGTSTTASIVGNAESRYFGVVGWGDSWHLLVNTTEPYDGRVRIAADIIIVEVSASGDWTIEFE